MGKHLETRTFGLKPGEIYDHVLRTEVQIGTINNAKTPRVVEHELDAPMRCGSFYRGLLSDIFWLVVRHG